MLDNVVHPDAPHFIKFIGRLAQIIRGIFWHVQFYAILVLTRQYRFGIISSSAHPSPSLTGCPVTTKPEGEALAGKETRGTVMEYEIEELSIRLNGVGLSGLTAFNLKVEGEWDEYGFNIDRLYIWQERRELLPDPSAVPYECSWKTVQAEWVRIDDEPEMRAVLDSARHYIDEHHFEDNEHVEADPNAEHRLGSFEYGLEARA